MNMNRPGIEGGRMQVPASEVAPVAPDADEEIEMPADEDEDEAPEATGKLEIVADARSTGDIAESTLEVSRRSREVSVAKAKENATIIAVKKLEAGMDPADLNEMLAGELEEVEDVIEGLEDDQPVVLESAVAKRESLLAQIKAVQEYQIKKAA
jgi:hypothetical protein